jgi:hypothetical protein
MTFVTPSTNESHPQIYVIEEVPSDSSNYDEFYSIYGYPVNVEIYGQTSDNPDTPLALLAKQDSIAWIEQEGILYDFDIDDINNVLRYHNGTLAIYMEEDESTELLVPVLEEGRVVVTWIDTMYYDEYEEDEEELV